jgi:FkbM family methyltransferase
MSLSSRLRRTVVGAVYSGYYRARDLNYAYGRPTRKTAGETRFRTYELYNLHGRDELLKELTERTQKDDVVYDIGANVGVYTCAVASSGADVVAFEPNPAAREKLQRNLEANGFEATVSPKAVSDEDGTETFYVSSYPEVSSLLRRKATVSGGSVVESTDVKTRTVDTLSCCLSEPDHIKIDVEGAGGAVLRGAKRTLEATEPTVYFEPHGDESDDRELLEKMGYTVDDLGEGWVCTPH